MGVKARVAEPACDPLSRLKGIETFARNSVKVKRVLTCDTLSRLKGIETDTIDSPVGINFRLAIRFPV